MMQPAASQFRRVVKVVRKLADGWVLHPDGRDGFGGHCWKFGYTGFKLSQDDMAALFGSDLIRWAEETDTWELTRLGYTLSQQYIPSMDKQDDRRK